MTPVRCIIQLLSISVAALSIDAAEPAPTREQFDFFEAKIRPVLAERCYECHSADVKKLKGGLLLDSREGVRKGGETGPAISPGEPEKSLLIAAIRHLDKDTAMPPKTKLPEHEIAALEEWVRIGAPDPRTSPSTPKRSEYDWEHARKHWAYRPLTAAAAPEVKDAAWPRNEIDQFILAKLETKGLGPTGDADRRTLLRRVTYDLTGLPPTPEALTAFLGDDSPHAFETVIESLLASPQHGERWGRHWMDVVRYADTAGDNSDYPIPQAWRYRTYIIDAFNRDKPFDQFIREQIAGDLLPALHQAQRNEQIIATGYIALSRRFGSVVDRYPHHLTIEDTLDNLGRTFLGLGLSCARCHDHKFDAISQRDYYGLYGIFESTRYAFPGIELLKIQKDFVPLLSAEELEKTLAPFREKDRELQARHDRLVADRLAREKRKKEFESLIAAAGGEKAKFEGDLATLNEEIVKVRGEIRKAAEAIEAHRRQRPAVPDAYAVQDGKPTDAKIQLKGEPERLGEVVPRKFLEVLGGQELSPEATKSSGRLELAQWIADPKNPLTARVLVNRVWQYHFGSGLVSTPNDFGVRGQSPSHPELLDWLAGRFVADGWSLKKLHKRILLSRTYQLASSGSRDVEGQLAADPENRSYWRFNRQRLDAESLRDTLLAMSGRLDPTQLTEPHPFPSPEKWAFTQHHPFRATYPSNRRSVYLMTSRLTASPFFQTFDGPDRNASTAARDSSVTSVQALYFLNDHFVHDQTERFAERLRREASDHHARVERAFSLALQRTPTTEECGRVEAHFAGVHEKLSKVSASAEKQEQSAWASFARSLFRTNEFLYLD